TSNPPVLFLLLLRRPPSSTPFPYTTLFRSELERAVHDGEAVALAGEWAEVHGAEAEPADPEPALAETDVVHAGVSTTPRGVSERSEEHTSELQSRGHLVCRLLLEKKK